MNKYESVSTGLSLRTHYKILIIEIIVEIMKHYEVTNQPQMYLLIIYDIVCLLTNI